MSHLFRSFLSGLAGIILASAPLQASAEQPLTIYTVNYPLQYFAQRIAGEHAQVIFPGPADADPAFWMPDTETIQRYQQADLILLNGAGYAKWTKYVSLPRLRSVDTSAGFQDRLIREQGGSSHSHGPGAEHSHAGIAFTTWLDFYQAVKQAQTIADVLSRKQPAHQPDFEKNFMALREDLMALDLEMQQTVATNPRLPLFASHPIYQYLARRYELPVEDMVWEPDEMPNDQQWQQLQLVRERFPAEWMLWENQPLPEIAQQLDGMGIGIAVFDPCAKRPAKGDFLSVMQQNIANLRRAYTN